MYIYTHIWQHEILIFDCNFYFDRSNLLLPKRGPHPLMPQKESRLPMPNTRVRTVPPWYSTPFAIVEYTRLCGPLKAALERLQELQREIEENERLQREREEEVHKGLIYFVENMFEVLSFIQVYLHKI